MKKLIIAITLLTHTLYTYAADNEFQCTPYLNASHKVMDNGVEAVTGTAAASAGVGAAIAAATHFTAVAGFASVFFPVFLIPTAIAASVVGFSALDDNRRYKTQGIIEDANSFVNGEPATYDLKQAHHMVNRKISRKRKRKKFRHLKPLTLKEYAEFVTATAKLERLFCTRDGGVILPGKMRRLIVDAARDGSLMPPTPQAENPPSEMALTQ